MDFNYQEPWARQPFDTDLSWSVFLDYLSLPPPRSLATLARRPSCALSWPQLETLAHCDGWKVRAERWDQHLDQVRFEAQEQATREDAIARATRQGRLGKKLQRLAETEADKLLIQASRDAMVGTIQVRDMIRAAAYGVRIERLAMGDFTDKIETGPDLSGLSVEQLRTLRELQEKAGVE